MLGLGSWGVITSLGFITCSIIVHIVCEIYIVGIIFSIARSPVFWMELACIPLIEKLEV